MTLPENDTEIETDINKIQELAQEREKANWAFRCFLKSSDLPLGRIDSKVHELYREVSSRIDCTQCANCCKAIQPLLTKADVKRLAQDRELSVKEFRSRYLRADENGEGEIFNDSPCPLLKDNRCTVYDQRPADCRLFPHLHKRKFILRVTQSFFNYGLCPIIFNVFEGLKREFWRRRPRGWS